MYEYQGGATTTYYAGPTGAVALRRTGYLTNNGVFYLLGDHLGSTSTIVAQNGTVSAQSYYLPYGGNRSGVFSDITTKRFTGQYHEASLPGGEGLSYYNARWYDAQLGRFVSADSIVPGSANPQNLNRFAYTLNNPLRYTDPSGHGICDMTGSCQLRPAPSIFGTMQRYSISFGTEMNRNWTTQQKWAVLNSVKDVDNRFRQLARFRGSRPGEAWRKTMGTLTMVRSGQQQWEDQHGVLHDIDYGAQTFGRRIEFYDLAFARTNLHEEFRNNVVHEIGHAFNFVRVQDTTARPYADLGRALGKGLPSRNTLRDGMNSYPWQQNTRDTRNENYELFGDGFLNWTYNAFNNEPEGVQTSRWFDKQMPLWVNATTADIESMLRKADRWLR